MSTNILTAIHNIITSPVLELRSYYASRNRANSMGEALENYIKDVFAGTLTETDETKRLELLSDTFSYQGNQNNPPDIIIRNGDAIEVKKIQSAKNTIQFNSSYPKSKLYINDPMLSNECRQCERWTEKDLLYIFGVVNESHLKKLFFIYGKDFASEAKTYENLTNNVRQHIREMPFVETADTNELGRINNRPVLKH
jgi:hypothetical protein